MSNSDIPRVGVEELDEPEGHYRLVINGDVVSTQVVIGEQELLSLAERLENIRLSIRFDSYTTQR